MHENLNYYIYELIMQNATHQQTHEML